MSNPLIFSFSLLYIINVGYCTLFCNAATDSSLVPRVVERSRHAVLMTQLKHRLSRETERALQTDRGKTDDFIQ